MCTDVLLFELSSQVTLFGWISTRSHEESHEEARPTLTKVVLPVPPSPTITIAKADAAREWSNLRGTSWNRISISQRKEVQSGRQGHRAAVQVHAPRTSLNAGIVCFVWSVITRNQWRKRQEGERLENVESDKVWDEPGFVRKRKFNQQTLLTREQ
jgi:hypothetical protein